ncbi:hypothetical protein [Sinomonas sp. ASV322]|uniref:Gp37-like protein n=1 Tax=Sinomonas sp. ASV322 TaxID=3041920 RepID=UPI0027DE7908|nr:hypothetical protein [Sinomonas sp. ASV322]MDQ4502188.1 hypothetical protein [Sinomonas sp. ASV322]
MESPFRLTLYDKSFARQGWLGDPIEVTATPAHNGPQGLTVTVSSLSEKAPILLEPGSRIVAQYRGEHLISGPVRSRSGKGPGRAGTMTFTVEDDWRLLQRVLGWPVPSAQITGQGAAEYDVVSGPAETVLKTLLTRNAVNRRGLPVTVAPDRRRGANITVSARFHPLADILLSALDTAGIGVTVRQSGSGLMVDVYEPTVHARELNDESGVVAEWEWASEAPEATDIVVGGQGEGTARQFALFQNAARAAEWGDVIEVFRDARDTNAGDVFAQRAVETFAETAEKTGLKIRLSETENFRYGRDGVHVGDRVSLRVGPDLVVTDILRSAELTWKAESGLEVTPKIGEIADSDDEVLAKAVRRTASALRDMRSR